MRSIIYLPAVLLPLALFLRSIREEPARARTPATMPGIPRNPRSSSIPGKAVNSVAPPKDPQLLFLLMAQYSNLNLQGEGAEFISARI